MQNRQKTARDAGTNELQPMGDTTAGDTHRHENLSVCQRIWRVPN
jgi:hypothetical protein